MEAVSDSQLLNLAAPIQDLDLVLVDRKENHVIPSSDNDDDVGLHLCNDCKIILAKFPEAETGESNKPFFSTTKQKVEAQAASGCQLCRWFLEYGDLQDDTELVCTKQIEHDFDENSLWLGGGQALLTKKLTISELDEGRSGNSFHREIPELILQRLQAPPRYLTCIAQARYWLGKCASHSTCHRKPSNFTPKRLVCIDPSDPTILQLSTKCDLPPDARYMTLSHCWGQSQVYRLLQKNYESLRSSINYHELPKNFRDAILVAWGLNTFYLWIDSLCIIQDSLSDWQQESAAMAEIYSHGLTNICATGASDGDCGLFLDRQLPSFPNLNLKLRLSDDGTAQTYHTADLKMWREGVEQSPLISRAWVLQERFLSHSNIHFGSTQMFWECSAGCTLETYTTRFLSDKYTSISRKTNFSATDSFPSVKPGIAGDQEKSNEQSDQEDEDDNKGWKVAELWNQVVESYSSCALTNDTDRLVALSGIASKFANFLATSFSKPNDPFIPSYFAGIWNRDIINQLLWQRMTDNPVSRPDRYIAPTWSWASVDRGTYNEFYHATILSLIFMFANFNQTTRTHQVASAEMQTTLADKSQPFGQVTAGTLSLDTKMAKGRIEKGDSDGSYLLHFEGVEEPIVVNWDARDCIMLVSDLDDDHLESSGRTVYFVPLRATVDISTVVQLEEDGKAPWREKEYHGLMLVSVDPEALPDGLPSRYQRIGRWMMWDSMCIGKFFEAMQFCEEKYGDLVTEGCEDVKFFGIGDKAFRVEVI